MTFDPTVDYPLGSRRPDLVETPSGLALEEVTLESARAGTLVAADVRATSATLRRQAAVARGTGRSQLADNLERAAELAGEDPTIVEHLGDAYHKTGRNDSALQSYRDALGSSKDASQIERLKGKIQGLGDGIRADGWPRS